MKNEKFLLKTTLLKYSFLVLVAVVFTACTSTKSVTYFYESPDATYKTNLASLEPVLQANDLLSITVSSINPEAAEMFNKSNRSEAQTTSALGNASSVTGYLVDQEGYIRFPVIGKVYAKEKTKKELREEITSILEDRQLLIDPIVDVRYLNYKVSVLGEVKNPSVLTIPSEKISIFEALGLAGDITVYGKKDNVVLLREEDGAKKLRRLDLTSSDIISSPYFYLQSNDILYVEANNRKIASTSQTIQWIPVIISVISLGFIIATQTNSGG